MGHHCCFSLNKLIACVWLEAAKHALTMQKFVPVAPGQAGELVETSEGHLNHQVVKNMVSELFVVGHIINS